MEFKNRVNEVCASVRYVSQPVIVTVLAFKSLFTLVEEVIPLATILVRSFVTGISAGKVRTTLHPRSMGRPRSKVKIPDES